MSVYRFHLQRAAETQALREIPDHKAPQVPKAHRAFRVSPARKVRQEPKDHRVPKVPPATRVIKARKGRKAIRETRAIPAKAIKVTAEKRATRAT